MTAHHYAACINHARRDGFHHFAQAMTDLFLATATPRVLRTRVEDSPALKRAAVKASFSASPWGEGEDK